MLVRFTKEPPAAQADTIACVRLDGSTTTAAMPRQGILPHEAFHFVVEHTLGWRDAFFGQVQRGAALDAATAQLHGPSVEPRKLTQALQAECLVECLQAQQWAGAPDPAAFAAALVRACRRRAVPPPEITAEELERVRVALRAFGAAWRPLAAGASLERTF